MRALLAIAALAGASGCLPGLPGVLPGADTAFATGRATILSPPDSFVLRVEIAETPRQKSAGLMGRAELPEDRGMLFLFDEEQPAETEFWMYRTPVPLSIAFLDADGRIRGIRELEPCTSRFSFRCPRLPAGVPFHGALEVNRGYFEGRGIGPGDRVLLRREPPAEPSAPGTAPDVLGSAPARRAR